MTAEPARWEEAIEASVAEIRKLGVHGVTPGEMERYASALLTDAEQLAAQGDMISHGDQLAYLMETVANGHTFMSSEQSYAITEAALSTLTLEEVNSAASELCAHITGLNDGEAGSRGPSWPSPAPRGAPTGTPRRSSPRTASARRSHGRAGPTSSRSRTSSCRTRS
ncbi:hypothetical protein THAOC_16771 [Thalassiosira oceanica]|uniref:Uncharacterized protein n=1 Tax=Thalassiosira oceanica TaxID=159749 RepID=K0SCE6_THAOC|nr:hypothetical protein THAOC_16771 [Thalassiosira oceanica]|eukprot:EJK62609.1 hypothetical protein THAOC_16771 [Thalassiosira oceanica]